MGLFKRRPAEPPVQYASPDPNWLPPNNILSVSKEDLAHMTDAEISAYNAALDTEWDALQRRIDETDSLKPLEVRAHQRLQLVQGLKPINDKRFEISYERRRRSGL